LTLKAYGSRVQVVTEPENPEVQKQFAAALRRKREALKWSQFKLAVEAHLHPQTISDIERGVRGSSDESRQAIALAMGSTVEDLLSLEAAS
jgi:transcriptional regulator with XRE-family HTH domain